MMAFSGQQDWTWFEFEKSGAYAAIFTISGTRSMPILKAASAIASCRAAGITHGAENQACLHVPMQPRSMGQCTTANPEGPTFRFPLGQVVMVVSQVANSET